MHAAQGSVEMIIFSLSFPVEMIVNYTIRLLLGAAYYAFIIKSSLLAF